MITLRPYQSDGVRDLTHALVASKKRSVLLEMPTGGGKTVVFSYIAQQANKKNSTTLILTDRRELLKETGGTLRDMGMNPFLIRAGIKNPPGIKGMRISSVYVAMAQTLKKKLTKGIYTREWIEWFSEINLIIIDECHKQEFNYFFESGLFEKKTIIGVTATPIRSGLQIQLGEQYDSIVHTKTTVELIELGHLVPEIYFTFKAPDTESVKLNTKGEFQENAMFKKFEQNKCYEGLSNAYLEHTPDSVMLVFCSNRIHSVRTAIKLCEAGIPAKFLVSPMSAPELPSGAEFDEKGNMSARFVTYYEKKEYFREYSEAIDEYSGNRDCIISDWKLGKFKVLVNSGILTTGFNYPKIQTVAFLRAINSLSLWLQSLGRGSRPYTNNGYIKTHFNVLDFGGNEKRLLGYRYPRKWSLWHAATKAGSGNPPVKECAKHLKPDKRNNKGCGAFIYASAKICPYCGYIYPEKKPEKEVILSATYKENGEQIAVKPFQKMTKEELESFWKKSGLPKVWMLEQIRINDRRKRNY